MLVVSIFFQSPLFKHLLNILHEVTLYNKMSMFRKISQILRSNKTRNKLSAYSTMFLMGYATYLLFTLDKPMFKATRA